MRFDPAIVAVNEFNRLERHWVRGPLRRAGQLREGDPGYAEAAEADSLACDEVDQAFTRVIEAKPATVAGLSAKIDMFHRAMADTDFHGGRNERLFKSIKRDARALADAAVEPAIEPASMAAE